MKLKSIFFSLLACGVSATTMAQNNISMVVGTYTDGGSEGIYSLSFNQDNGTATPLSSLPLVNPSYLTFSKDGKYIYAVSETNDNKAALSAIRFYKKDGKMLLLNTELTHGEDPCYVEVGKNFALTANYSGGSLTYFPILPTGELAPGTAVIKGHIGGTDKSRQNAPHIHCTKIAPDGYIFASDFSADQILAFQHDKKKKQLVEQGVATKLEKESGPRHIIFSPNGARAYVMSELSDKVTAYNYINGKFGFLQSEKCDDINARGGADLHISPDGKFLYCSNRLEHDGITIFRIASSGRITKVGYQETGVHPRNFAITPNGKYLLVACRDSNVIQVFERNADTGLLTDTHQDLTFSKPVCIKFFPKSE